MTGTTIMTVLGVLLGLCWRVGWPRQAPQREPVAFSVRGQRVERRAP